MNPSNTIHYILHESLPSREAAFLSLCPPHESRREANDEETCTGFAKEVKMCQSESKRLRLCSTLNSTESGSKRNAFLLLLSCSGLWLFLLSRFNQLVLINRHVCVIKICFFNFFFCKWVKVDSIDIYGRGMLRFYVFTLFHFDNVLMYASHKSTFFSTVYFFLYESIVDWDDLLNHTLLCHQFNYVSCTVRHPLVIFLCSERPRRFWNEWIFHSTKKCRKICSLT